MATVAQSLDVTANRRRMGAIVSGPRLPRALLFATGKHPRIVATIRSGAALLDAFELSQQ